MDSDSLFNFLKGLNKSIILAIFACGFDTVERFALLASDDEKFQRAIVKMELFVKSLDAGLHHEALTDIPPCALNIVSSAKGSAITMVKFSDFGDTYKFDKLKVRDIKRKAVEVNDYLCLQGLSQGLVENDLNG